MKKLCVLFILVGFILVAGCGGPQRIQFKSCEEKAGVETECRTFLIEGEASILPF